MSALYQNTFEKMFEAAELCRDQALDVPMLVLIYTSLDTLAWAVYSHETHVIQPSSLSGFPSPRERRNTPHSKPLNPEPRPCPISS